MLNECPVCGSPIGKLIKTLIEDFDSRERLIFESRLFAEKGEKLTYRELGRRLSVSGQRVQQIEERAIKRLEAKLSSSL